MNLKQIPKVLDSKTSCLRIRVPENLDLALEGLIRKVLREQPKTDDIYSFAANYFETLLKIRDKAGTKLTPSQICPFHNDEDAHEMIKIAGTFKKPQKTSEEWLEIQRKKGSETQQKKDVKKPPKSKQTVKDKKSVKRPTPDLIKKLPMTTETQSEDKQTKETPENEKQKEVKPEISEEKTEIENEEFLTSDPIKELVEKELLMEGKLNGKEKETSQLTAPTEVNNLESLKAETETKNEKEEQKLDDKKNELLIEDTLVKKEEKEKIETENQDVDKKQATAVNAFEETIANVEETNKEEIEEKQKETPVETAGKEEKAASKKEAEALQTEEIEKKEMKKDEVEGIKETDQNEKTLIEGENIVETPKENQIQTLEDEKDKKEEETKQKIQEEENKKTETKPETETMNETTEKLPESPKQTAKGDEIPNKILNEGDTIPTAEVQETKYVEPSTENEINATGGKQQETEIDKETKATDENTAKTAEETLPVGENSFVTNHSENEILTGINNNEKHEEKTTETEEQTVKNKEEIIPTEVETKEIPKEEKTNIENISQDEGKSEVTEEVKETTFDDSESKQNILKNEEEPVTDTEKKDNKEKDVNEDAKVGLEEPNEKTEDAKTDETFKLDENDVKAESQISEKKPTGEEITKQEEKPIEKNQKSETSNIEQIPDALNTIGKESEHKKIEEKPAEENLENVKDKTPQTEKEQPKKTQETTESQEGVEKIKETTTEILTESQKTSAGDGKLNEEQKPSENDNQTEEELCTVVDSQNIQKKDETEITETQEVVHPDVDQNQKDKKTETEAEELCGVVDVQNITEEKAEDGILKPEEEVLQSKENETNPEELCTVVDGEHIPKKDTTEEEIKPKLETVQNMAEVEPPHIVEPEKMQNPEVSLPSEEVQIKTIQTHYYDTLQVPETVTKEYIVHDLSTPSTPSITTLLSVANSLHQNYKETQKPVEEKVKDENMTPPPPPIGFMENITVSPPSETEDHLKNIQTEGDAQNQQETESSIQITDSDDLLDIMTPTSGYSLNLSEISWQTINGVFLDSERRYSSLEKEEIRYTTPKSDDQNRQEVEEVIHKTVLPTGIEAVPVPPEEINEEVNIETTETEKDKKEEKDEGGEPEGSSDSTNGKSGDSDIPFISVEVKTVIETQMLDEEDVEEEKEQRRRPGVEVKVEATIDIQDEVEPTEEENKISNGKSQEIGDLKSSLEDQKNKSGEEERKESCSTEQTTGREGSSGESDTTISSAATEIKRTDSGKRNFSSTRSLLSTQSLDLGKRNPLLKTRSLSTFRHGVTDFEVWNTIEKELEEAATKIQSKFRGYKTRKKLQRENAVQITTEESSVTTTPVEAEAEAEEEKEETKTRDKGQQSTGEFHDSIVLAEHPR